ncbi:hypothetical protein GCM10022239_27010 [Leifsonia bigeumensis]|uniref:Uncharacterized protein n=1 Tax=Leifsonella bigeumensis TaxID=433643 RepID=A0ABP7FYE4_9MICO
MNIEERTRPSPAASPHAADIRLGRRRRCPRRTRTSNIIRSSDENLADLRGARYDIVIPPDYRFTIAAIA